MYRSLAKTPTAAERAAGEKELRAALAAYRYEGQPLPARLTVRTDRPVIDYFKQFPGLDAGANRALPKHRQRADVRVARRLWRDRARRPRGPRIANCTC